LPERSRIQTNPEATDIMTQTHAWWSSSKDCVEPTERERIQNYV
jgi:hypothetical protein